MSPAVCCKSSLNRDFGHGAVQHDLFQLLWESAAWLLLVQPIWLMVKS